MKLISTIAAAAFLASAVSASAQSARLIDRTDDNGVTYRVSENVNGIVMQGDNGSTLYLGRDCDAFHTTFGAGSWGFANAGFWANLSSGGVFFPRNDHPGVRNYDKCWE